MLFLKYLIMTVSLAAAIAGYTQEKKLLGYWKFAEGQGISVKDFSGNKYDGIIARDGKNTLWTEGKSGKALKFTTDDPKKIRNKGCMVIKNLGEYDFSKGVTVTCWINFKHQRSGTQEIVSNAGSDRGPGFRFLIAYRSIRFVVGDGKKLQGAELKFSAKSDTWYFIAATYNGRVFRVYAYESDIDPGGSKFKEFAESKEGIEFTKGRKDISVGAYAGGYAYSLNGIIDELKIYNYAKDEIEILDAASGEE
ncbi:MAG: hypothetical protein PHV82_17405 [Victivallaceae bacterium]|nr:hypothetical protein [Victivallaceae bacterium]